MKKTWLTIGEDQKEIFKALSPAEVMDLKADEIMAYQEDKFKNDVAPFEARIKSLEDLAAKGGEEGEEAVKAAKTLEAVKKELSDIKKYQDDVLIEVKKMKEGGSIAVKGEGSLQVFLKSESVTNHMKGKKSGFVDLALKAPELMAVGTVGAGTPSIVGSTGGYSTIVGNYVDSEIGITPKDQNFILPLVNVTSQPGTEKIWWTERTNEEGDAAFIGEGTLKPLVSAKWETKDADVKEVADRWKMTDRLMNHAPSVVNEFREHAEQLVDQVIDDQLLSGTGVGADIAGIALSASAFVAPPALAAYYVDANIWDVINACLSTVSLANFNSSAIVLNTVWEAAMKGIKATDGVYLVPPFVTSDGKTVSGVKITFTNKISDAKILCGDLKKFRVVFSENVKYAQGYSNDDFDLNLTSHKLEAFLGTYFKSTDAGSIVYDDIATVVAAIDKP